jgi:hypothetical protein
MLVQGSSEDCTTQFAATMPNCPACGAPAPAIPDAPVKRKPPFNLTRGFIAFLVLACPAWYWVFTSRSTQSLVVACLASFIALALSLEKVSLRNVAAGTAASFVAHNVSKSAGRRLLERLEDKGEE